jgi:hypothetical protein
MVTDASDIRGACMKRLDELERTTPFRTETAVHVLGSGIAIAEDGSRHWVPNLVWISGDTIWKPTVMVATQSDIWLPYDLRGRPQTAVYDRNRGRLEHPLEAVQSRCGLTLSHEETTDYARINGFRLENLRTADGTVADTITNERTQLESGGL